MSEAIEFADAEAMATTWLTGKLGTGVEISGKVPAARPDAFVKVSLTGGFRHSLPYHQAQLTFECWGPDEGTAADLAATCYAQVFAAEGETINGSFVSKVVEIGGPTNFPDPESKSPRYQFTIGLRRRGAAT